LRAEGEASHDDIDLIVFQSSIFNFNGISTPKLLTQISVLLLIVIVAAILEPTYEFFRVRKVIHHEIECEMEFLGIIIDIIT